MRLAMKVLAREHLALRGIARVLKMEALIVERGGHADVEVLRAIVEYIDEFPDKIHHPKEEDFIFAAMRRRSVEPIPVLDRLLKEHHHEYELIRRFHDQVEAYAKDPAGEAANFAFMAKSYVAFLDNHMRMENHEAFPLAQKLLTEDDWEAIDKAFAENIDPLSGEAPPDRFSELQRRIMDLGLPPFGAGH
ncbi:MAG TPA: hemerythrin domain-containing protein [Hyphomicrobiales bacterium]|nr:hemerythrin domain-containing protein [Kaistiaceae bacterium]HQF30524.1 hemerythrin domain-containing protein [Hyphomicrobiales bacterium]